MTTSVELVAQAHKMWPVARAGDIGTQWGEHGKATNNHPAIVGRNYFQREPSISVGRIKDSGNVKVPIKTIDSFQYQNVGFIKYDIEGYELRAIKGSEQTIKKYFPVIIVEQNKGNTDAVELLQSWGYKLKGIDDMFKSDYLMVKQ